MTTHIVSSGRLVRKNRSLVIVMALAMLLASAGLSQETRSGNEPQAPVARKKARGRLPAYFSAVVTQKQREAIYKLQSDYEMQLEKLRAEMDKLIAARDQEVDAVLSAEQLAEVNKKREEAKKRRAARSSSSRPATEPTDG